MRFGRDWGGRPARRACLTRRLAASLSRARGWLAFLEAAAKCFLTQSFRALRTPRATHAVPCPRKFYSLFFGYQCYCQSFLDRLNWSYLEFLANRVRQCLRFAEVVGRNDHFLNPCLAGCPQFLVDATDRENLAHDRNFAGHRQVIANWPASERRDDTYDHCDSSGRSFFGNAHVRGQYSHIETLPPLCRDAKIGVLGANELCRCLDAFSHDLLDRAERHDAAGSFRRLHFKPKNAPMIPFNRQADHLANRGRLRQSDPLDAMAVGQGRSNDLR